MNPNSAAPDLYYKTDGTNSAWTSSVWGSSPGGPFTSAWVSGDDAFFTATSTITGATTTIADITASADVTVNEPDARMDTLLRPLYEATGEDAVYRSSLARAVEAGVLATQARWAQAEQRYDTALAALKKYTGQRKGVLRREEYRCRE